jgi:acetyl esterase/lipase
MHGGGWTTGSTKIIGPLLTEMISQDWIVVAVNYRMNTKTGYPTQLMDCKRALRWVKDEIQTFGGNPNNIIVAGDSAGGQLACMLALTANQPEYQPGFESVDTTVQGCLALSAILDLVDMNNWTNHDLRGQFIKDVAKREGSPNSADSRFLFVFLLICFSIPRMGLFYVECFLGQLIGIYLFIYLHLITSGTTNRHQISV